MSFVDGLDRDGCVYLAKLAEQAERYDDMVTYMKSIGKIRFACWDSQWASTTLRRAVSSARLWIARMVVGVVGCL